MDTAIVRQLDATLSHLNEPRVTQALERIEGLDRKLLAARSYLRNRAVLAQRWSWSQEEIALYPGSELQRTVDAEIAKVRKAFEGANAGYTLWVNPDVRSVELQTQRWNENPTVGAAASAFLQATRAAMRDRPGLLLPPDVANSAVSDAERELFERLLTGRYPTPTPTLAAPGLSRHGRMQAIDFQVRRTSDGATVAGPVSADVDRVWRAQRWADRLQRAVLSSGARLRGPLQVPAEPWHYEVVAGGK